MFYDTARERKGICKYAAYTEEKARGMCLDQRIEMFWNSALTATNARALTNQIEPSRRG
jgi:hypothetical protein